MIIRNVNLEEKNEELTFGKDAQILFNLEVYRDKVDAFDENGQKKGFKFSGKSKLMVVYSLMGATLHDVAYGGINKATLATSIQTFLRGRSKGFQIAMDGQTIPLGAGVSLSEQLWDWATETMKDHCDPSIDVRPTGGSGAKKVSKKMAAMIAMMDALVASGTMTRSAADAVLKAAEEA